MEELERQADALLLHWCGNHTLYGDWCVSKKAAAEGKNDDQKSVFDLTLDANKLSIEQVRTIQEKFTKFKRLLQMNHTYITQLNDFNMWIAELSPKWKHFSQSRSLLYRVGTTITTHNLGLRALTIVCSTV